jgi:heme A synthase
MNKIRALRILNPILAILLFLQILSGLIPTFLSYQAHRTLGILFAAGVILHLILNWNWIRANLLNG